MKKIILIFIVSILSINLAFALPNTTDITSSMQINNSETWEDNFTISAGPINLGIQGNGNSKPVLIIKNVTVTNNARNSTDNAAFVVNALQKKLITENVSINTLAGSTVVFVKNNSEARFIDTEIIGDGNDWNEADFLRTNAQAAKIYLEGETIIDNIKNSRFINYGIFTVTAGSDVTIKNSSFLLQNNDNKGGDLNIEGDLTLENTEITVEGRPVFYVKSGATLTLKDSILKNAKIEVENGGNLVIDNSTITDSSSIFITKGNLEIKNNSKILNNTSTTFTIENSNVTIDQSIFEGNNGYLGGVFNISNSEVTVKNESVFENNTATHGGAMYLKNSNLTILNSSFLDNYIGAWGDGGAISFTNGNLEIKENAIFKGNSGGLYGGAIVIRDSEVVINEATFEENGIIDEDNGKLGVRAGGAIAHFGGKMTLNGTIFENNTANSLHEYYKDYSVGGAMLVDANSSNNNNPMELIINDATFDGNTSVYQGGGLSIGFSLDMAPGEVLNATINKAKFINNEVTGSLDGIAGGGLYIHTNGKVKMVNAAIYDNYAEGAGAGIATCPLGTSFLNVYNGSAIFDNTAELKSTKGYEDIYLMDTADLKNEIYESMFNGGLHNWKVKQDVEFNSFYVKNENGDYVPTSVIGMYAGSNPTNKDISEASIIFTNNKTTISRQNDGKDNERGSGGAIGNNGILEIGEAGEVKLSISWEDQYDCDCYRPETTEINKIIKLFGNGKEISLEGKTIKVLENDEILSESNIVYSDGETNKNSENEWTIIISGLEKYDENHQEISYTLTQETIEGYDENLTEIKGFRIKNVIKANNAVSKCSEEESGPAKVIYVDENGNELTDAILWENKRIGSKFTTTKKNFANYEFVEVTGDFENKLSDDSTEVTIKKDLSTVVYVYKKIKEPSYAPNFPSCQIDSTTTSGIGSIDTKLTCNGTNTDDYRIEIIDKDGNILENVSGNSLNLKLNNPGEYSAVCHVKNSTATNSCKVPLTITKEPDTLDTPDNPETPEIPVCEALTVTADKGIETLDSRLTCYSKNAKNFKIEVKNELGIVVAGSNSNILDLNLDGIGVYEAVCYTDYYTSQNCKHILTVEEDDFEFNAPKELPKTGIGLYERVKNQIIRFIKR